MVVVEENRTSTGSTRSDVSQAVDLELTKLDTERSSEEPKTEHTMSTSGVSNDLGGGEILSEKFQQHEDYDSITSDDNNCASILMPQDEGNSRSNAVPNSDKEPSKDDTHPFKTNNVNIGNEYIENNQISHSEPNDKMDIVPSQDNCNNVQENSEIGSCSLKKDAESKSELRDEERVENDNVNCNGINMESVSITCTDFNVDNTKLTHSENNMESGNALCRENMESVNVTCSENVENAKTTYNEENVETGNETCNQVQTNLNKSELEISIEDKDNSDTVKDPQEDLDPFQNELDNELYEGISDYIPKEFWKTNLKCLTCATVQEISWRLDLQEEICCDQFPKDFTGLCQRLNLDPAFTKYLVKSQFRLKTEEVISKWEVLPAHEGPRPTVGNFCKIVYFDLDRPDVITDLKDNIVRDATSWEKTRSEASTKKPEDEDLSWQLTRHDVAMGKKTYYTACICNADEDEGTAAMITNFFQTVCKGTRFFRPQFDLKTGKYVFDTTAKVIEERCNGKVIFLLSDYFYASKVCQFAVNFAHQKDPTAEQGNLIPFYLTDKYEMAPKVLKGIAGVRWVRQQFRYHSWSQLSDCLLSKAENGSSLVQTSQSELTEVQERIKIELENNKSSWLCDAPYDSDIPEPGPALPLHEPPDDPVNSTSLPFNPDSDENDPIVSSHPTRNKSSFVRNIRRPVDWVVSKFTKWQRKRTNRRSGGKLNDGFTAERGSSSVV